MRSLADAGMTMILVTHEMGFARQVANTVVFMHEGRVWESGSPSILDQPQSAELRAFIGSGL
jgi:polar amino acid transport system ATP-binding protein